MLFLILIGKERNKLRAKGYFERSRPPFVGYVGVNSQPHTVRTNSFVSNAKRGGVRHGSRTRRYNETRLPQRGFGGPQPVGSLPGTAPRALFGALPDLNKSTRDFRHNGRVNIQPLPFSKANEGRPVKYRRSAFDKWQSGFKLGEMVIQAELLNSHGRHFAPPVMVSRYQVKFEPR